MTRLTITTFLLVSLISMPGAYSQVKQPESGSSLAKAQEEDSLSSPQVYPPDDPRETAALNRHCPGIKDMFKCAPVIERVQLPQYPQVTRQKGELKLALTTGKVVVFTDRQRDQEDNEAQRYFFRDYLKGSGFFLIQALLYEDAGYYMVNDQTGEKFFLKDLPILSPDKTRLVTIRHDLVYLPRNTMQIWRFAPGRLIKEWEFDAGDKWGPAGGVWLDNDTISFTKKILKRDYSCTEIPMILKKAQTGWKISEK
jgi:hypothetical protein